MPDTFNSPHAAPSAASPPAASALDTRAVGGVRLNLADQADYNAAVTMGHDTQPVLDRAYGRTVTNVAAPIDHQARVDSALPFLDKAVRTVTDLAAQIAAEKAERDTKTGMMRNIQTLQIARLVARYDAAMGDVQRISRVVAEGRAAMEMKQAAE